MKIDISDKLFKKYKKEFPDLTKEDLLEYISDLAEELLDEDLATQTDNSDDCDE